jgi:AcrR family transcriptional regulator
MPRPRQSDEQIAAMRERILDATAALMAEKGSEALSIRGIARRVGVSHMVLYTYFENRDALVAALSERQCRRMQAHFAQIVPQTVDGDVRQVLRDSLALYLQFAREDPRRYRFAWVEPVDPGCFADRGRRMETNLQHLSRLVQLGIERDQCVARDPALAAVTAFGIVNAPLILYHSGRLSDPSLRDRIFAEAVDAAMGYLCHERVHPSQELDSKGE